MVYEKWIVRNFFQNVWESLLQPHLISTFLYPSDMMEKRVYTEVKSLGKRKRMQSRTADTKYEGGKTIFTESYITVLNMTFKAFKNPLNL